MVTVLIGLKGFRERYAEITRVLKDREEEGKEGKEGEEEEEEEEDERKGGTLGFGREFFCTQC